MTKYHHCSPTKYSPRENTNYKQQQKSVSIRKKNRNHKTNDYTYRRQSNYHKIKQEIVAKTLLATRQK